MQIHNAIFTVAFVAGFAVTEAVVIHDPDAIRPIRERALVRAYRRAAKDFESLLKRAKEGNADAQYDVGMAYLEEGPRRDESQAELWLGRSAEQGLAKAQFMLGVLRSDENNYKEAEMWYRLAAQQGDAQAQNRIGVMYAKGRGVPQNNAEAVKWFRLAAAQEYAWAQYNLGEAYDTGDGISQNKDTAAKWRLSAAMKGHSWAQYKLGMAYIEVQGHMEAVQWLSRAARQGHAKSQCQLGKMYAEGEGVSQDFEEATEWFRLAAEQGVGIDDLEELEEKEEEERENDDEEEY